MKIWTLARLDDGIPQVDAFRLAEEAVQEALEWGEVILVKSGDPADPTLVTDVDGNEVGWIQEHEV